MRAIDYINKFYPYALEGEEDTGISADAMLTHSVAEAGWTIAPGNAMFGVKDTDGLNGNEQLLRTKEYSTSPDLKFPKIYSIDRVIRNGIQMFKYDCDCWFRKYDTPADSFRDYAKFIQDNPRYAKALAVKSNPELYLREIAKAGYATGPNYEEYLMRVLHSIQKRLPNEKTKTTVEVPSRKENSNRDGDNISSKRIASILPRFNTREPDGLHQNSGGSDRGLRVSTQRDKGVQRTNQENSIERQVNDRIRFKAGFKISLDKVIQWIKSLFTN